MVVQYMDSEVLKVGLLLFRNKSVCCFTVCMLLISSPLAFCQSGSGAGRGVYRALLIGNNRYSGTWQPLQTSVNDVRKITDVLIGRYGFEKKNVQVLENVDRRRMLKGFYDLASVSTPHDSVLIYYAGHGDSGRGNSSWWVPVGAEQNYDYISAQEIGLRLNLIPARHKLLIADSCFSGSLFGGNRAADEARQLRQGDRAASTGSIQVISSGGDGPVSDGGARWGGHSIFAYHLIAQLKAYSGKGLAADQLAGSLVHYVSRDTRQLGKQQVPRIVSLQQPGQEGGYTFVVRESKKGAREKGLLLAFLCDGEGDFDVHGRGAREQLFRELVLIFQRNGLRIVNQPLCVTSAEVDKILKLKLDDFWVSRALLIKLDVTVEKHQTRIWRAMAKADATAQVFLLLDGNIATGDAFRLRTQKLPVDYWEGTSTYRKNQYRAVVSKLMGSFRETGFAAFLRHALD